MDLDYLKASDGTGKAILAHIESDRAISSTVIDVDSVDNFPAKFILTTGTLNASGFIIESTMTEMKCHLNAGDIIIDSFEPGYSDVGNTDGQVAIIKQTTGWANLVQEGLAQVVSDTAAFIASSGDWRTQNVPAVSSVTANGDRSHDVTFASTVAGILSPGNFVKLTRTVTAPTYMGGLFNGSSHYFVKATPTSTLSTVTNNFTLMGFIYPTVYQFQAIADRCDGTAANSMELVMTDSGRIRIQVSNGGSSNYRYVESLNAIPLNRKTHVAASWASGTVVIYINGRSVPVLTAVTSGTAPTTAGTGGDFAIGRRGSSSNFYAAGYMSGVGVFNAVLTAATIRSYIGQVLTGSETNCIGAWSLNNTGVNQQAAGTNDLTASGGVSYTSGMSPYATDNLDVGVGTTEYGIVMRVNGAVATIQTPDGCLLPTTGGISAVAYSKAGSPLGFPKQEWRHAIESWVNDRVSAAGTVSGTIYNIGGWNIEVPVGGWKASATLNLYHPISAANQANGKAELNPTAATMTARSRLAMAGSYVANITETSSQFYLKDEPIKVSAITPYYVNFQANSTGTLTAIQIFGDRVPCRVSLIPDCL